ncbi:MAG TPA: hypothetical protein PKI49_03355 [Pseudomonadota bacterium]|nr:hypothetical protein [Pseudomonadota bacterium]
MRLTAWLTKLVCTSVFSSMMLLGCHQSSQNVRPDYATPYGQDTSGYPQSEMQSGTGGSADEAYGGYGGAPTPSSPSLALPEKSRREAVAPRQVERPGLGTEFGESRYSPVRDVPFERGSSSPLFTGTIHYNDARGVEAQRERLLRRHYPGEPIWRSYVGNRPIPWSGVTVSVVDGNGNPLPAYHLQSHVLVVGSAGQHYSIVVENNTGQRFEMVASVDGQDVVDGRSASLEKRGYVVDAFHRVRIDGFRTSMTDVAAFRFGSVRNSYAARTSEFGDRNVGVIGIALFGERGAPAPAVGPDLDDEARRRESADPFPGRFSPPPPPPPPPSRPYY